MVVVAVSAELPADVPTLLPVSEEHEVPLYQRISGMAQPPLTPPPRA